MVELSSLWTRYDVEGRAAFRLVMRSSNSWRWCSCLHSLHLWTASATLNACSVLQACPPVLPIRSFSTRLSCIRSAVSKGILRCCARRPSNYGDCQDTSRSRTPNEIKLRSFQPIRMATPTPSFFRADRLDVFCFVWLKMQFIPAFQGGHAVHRPSSRRTGRTCFAVSDWQCGSSQPIKVATPTSSFLTADRPVFFFAVSDWQCGSSQPAGLLSPNFSSPSLQCIFLQTL